MHLLRGERGHHSTDRWGKYAIEHWNSRASLQSPDREKEIDTGEVAEQLRDMAASAYETAMHFGITQDSFEHLAHRVFDLACRVEGKA